MATVRDKEFVVSRYVGRSYDGRSDLHLLIPFAQQLARARSSWPSYYHPGDFVWQLYAFDGSDDVRLWSSREDEAAIVGCAIFEPPLNFQFAIDPNVDNQWDLAAEVIRWAEQRRALVPDAEEIPIAYQSLGSGTLSTTAMDSDAARIAFLVERGYNRDEKYGIRFALSLDDRLPAIELPSGARFRHISDGDAAARAELHRDAWSVWGHSTHSSEKYLRLRSAPLYDPDLDIVLEFDGQLVSYCVCWLDTANQVGYFEPVGTRPSGARRGFGRAVIREGLRRLRQKGMRTATVATAAINEPAVALYSSAGFNVVEHEHYYVKPMRTYAQGS